MPCFAMPNAMYVMMIGEEYCGVCGRERCWVDSNLAGGNATAKLLKSAQTLYPDKVL